jgi:hypothetical protein
MSKRIKISVDRTLEVTDHITMEVPDDFPLEGEGGDSKCELLETICDGDGVPEGFRVVYTEQNEQHCTDKTVAQWVEAK